MGVVTSDITNSVILHHKVVGQVDMLEKNVVGVGVFGNWCCGPGAEVAEAPARWGGGGAQIAPNTFECHFAYYVHCTITGYTAFPVIKL